MHALLHNALSPLLNRFAYTALHCRRAAESLKYIGKYLEENQKHQQSQELRLKDLQTLERRLKKEKRKWKRKLVGLSLRQPGTVLRTPYGFAKVLIALCLPSMLSSQSCVFLSFASPPTSLRRHVCAWLEAGW